MIAEKVAKINEKILEQISYLQIPQSNPPTQQELSNLWKVETKGLVKFVKDMDNFDRMTSESQGDFIVRDDNLDLQICHIESDWKPHRKTSFEASGQTSFDVSIVLCAITTKATAKNLILKAFENVGTILIDTINTNSKEVIEKYWIGKLKNWGQNPYYTAFAIKYKIKVPYIEVDYSQVN